MVEEVLALVGRIGRLMEIDQTTLIKLEDVPSEVIEQIIRWRHSTDVMNVSCLVREVACNNSF